MRPVIAALAIAGSLQAAWIMAAATPAGASGPVTYFVNQATGGNPSCGAAADTSSDPFNSIAGALTCAAADPTTPSTPDTVDIAAGTYDENDTVDANVNLVGVGASSTAIDGTASGTVLTIDAFTVSISDLTIEDGSAPGPGIAGFGGGIESAGILTTTDDTFSDNNAVFYGGAIENAGTLTSTGDKIGRASCRERVFVHV
jgi:hypothetical protein